MVDIGHLLQLQPVLCCASGVFDHSAMVPVVNTLTITTIGGRSHTGSG